MSEKIAGATTEEGVTAADPAKLDAVPTSVDPLGAIGFAPPLEMRKDSSIVVQLLELGNPESGYITSSCSVQNSVGSDGSTTVIE